MPPKKLLITKANGRKVQFNENKLIRTCVRAGASRKTAKKILEKVRSKLYQGIRTRDIYKLVLGAMDDEKNLSGLHQRYQLKDAIMQLGPAGFHFENYVANLLSYYGLKIKGIGKKIQGKCVKHEIDLIVESNGERHLIECKYHSAHGIYTGLKISLYTHARFLDTNSYFNGEAIVCNTKISTSAKKYAKCVGQKVYSWRYPPEHSLEKIIEKNKLYPITILDLTKTELSAFSKNNMMIAKDILKFSAPDLSKKTKISVKRIIFLQKLLAQILR